LTTYRDIAERAISAVGLLGIGRKLYRSLAPSHLRERAALARQIDAIMPHSGAIIAPSYGQLDAAKVALMVGYSEPGLTLLQFPLIAALRVCGYRVVVRLNVASNVIQAFYRRLGAHDFVLMEDVVAVGEHPQTASMMAKALAYGLMDIRYRDLSVGKYAASTLLRALRVGDINLADPNVRTKTRDAISASLRAADAAIEMISKTHPTLVCFVDRGYTPDGQLFEAAISRNIHATTLNAAHRGGLLMLKRYGRENHDKHPSSLSPESWKILRSMPWTDASWRILYGELRNCYESGSWYDEVGTQFGKTMSTRLEIVRSLGLDPAKKTAVIFAHMFWDATFFWGEDLFRNYEDWFRETLKAAALNPNVNWLVKVHPANLIKNERDKVASEHSEITAIREIFDELPRHITVLPADSAISTFSLFEMMDYCITVRGTVGIEGACFGIPVLTAGTGRYDRLGFTVDHDSREAYLSNLLHLERVAPLDDRQIELARRYAYGLILARPLLLESVRFSYGRDSKATMTAALAVRRPEDFGPDIAALAQWLDSGKEDFLTDSALFSAQVPVATAS
jgi:hypothetical protein